MDLERQIEVVASTAAQSAECKSPRGPIDAAAPQATVGTARARVPMRFIIGILLHGALFIGTAHRAIMSMTVGPISAGEGECR